MSRKYRSINSYYYSDEQKLGKGGIGEVYLAVKHSGKSTMQSSKHSKFALKVMAKDEAKDSIKKRFMKNEVQTLQCLESVPEVVHLYDHFQTQKYFYIVMELCEGGSLKEKIKTGPVSQELAIDYMIQILKGYIELMKSGIIHRDLKPSNILLDKNGNIKIADFGFAIFQTDVQKEKNLNAGSTFYMPPEVIRKNAYSINSDVWALGVILYELLVGRRPWTKKNDKELLATMENVSIDKFIPQNVQGVLRKILVQALDPDPSNRPMPQQLLDLLQRYKIKKERKIKDKDQAHKTAALISLLDFCRLKFNIFELINNEISSRNEYFTCELDKRLKNSLLYSIYTQLNKIESLEYLSPIDRQTYKLSNDYIKLTDLVDHYLKKYLPFYQNEEKHDLKSTLNQVLLWCHQNIKTSTSYTMLILYDYLTTLRWLSDLLSSEGFQQFYSKSRIDEVVQGLKGERISRTVRNIKKEDLKKLQCRLVQLHIIK